ncbi:site-specific integrase [Streptomyces sp. NPDC004230]
MGTAVGDVVWLVLVRVSAGRTAVLVDAGLVAERAAAHPRVEDALLLAVQLVANSSGTWWDLAVHGGGRGQEAACAETVPERDPGGAAPHDFRGIFARDALQAGLPPHITAKILGHEDVKTAMRYTAIYLHHSSYIARRRQLRPSEEYGDLTPEEWDEFIAHFKLRRVALGACTRDFETACFALER